MPDGRKLLPVPLKGSTRESVKPRPEPNRDHFSSVNRIFIAQKQLSKLEPISDEIVRTASKICKAVAEILDILVIKRHGHFPEQGLRIKIATS